MPKTAQQLSAMERPNLPGYIILGWDNTNQKYVGYVENSFSMSLSDTHTQFHWSGTGYSNFGGVHPGIDGAQDADREINGYTNSSGQYRDGLKDRHPEYRWESYDVHSDNLPVEIDWDGWRWGSERADTLSGVRNKFYARNPRFIVKEQL